MPKQVKGVNIIIPWYAQKTFWTAVAGFCTAVGAYFEGSIGIPGVLAAAFGAASVIFIRFGVEKSTYIPNAELPPSERGEEIK